MVWFRLRPQGGAPLQEPGFRMQERYILRGRPVSGPDPAFNPEVDSGQPGGGGAQDPQAAPARGLSLWRKGDTAAPPAPESDPSRPGGLASLPPSGCADAADPWLELAEITPDPGLLLRNNLFPDGGDHPAANAFDSLRTGLLQGLAQRGWSRIAITSPLHGCGKSFVALNLALGLARRPQSRTVLADLDLRRPALAGLLGLDPDKGAKPRWPGLRRRRSKPPAAAPLPPLAEFLRGNRPALTSFRRLGATLALGLNGRAEASASDLLHHPGLAASLTTMQAQLGAGIVLYDMPPALVCDDVLAMAGRVDAVLLVTDGAKSSAADIRACLRLFEGRLPLWGVVLNRAQDRRLGQYRYGGKA